MGHIRTTVMLDEDVLERVEQESRSRGASFDEALNELLRTGLAAAENQSERRELQIKPHQGGYYPDLNYDCTEALIEYLGGPDHR